MSSRFSSLVHLICLALFTMLLSACSRDLDEPKKVPEINSLNIFFEEVEYEGIRRGVIRSIDYAEGDGLPTVRDFYSPGENMAIALNTDAEKQGFEYAIYAENNNQSNQIRLLDYDKEFNGDIEVLQNFQATICGIRRSVISNPDAFDEDGDFYLSRLDESAVIVSLNDSVCDETTNQHYRIKFVRNRFDVLKTTERRFVSSSEAFGAHFFDPNFEQIPEEDANAEDDEDEEENTQEIIPPGEGLWIGYDNKGQTLRLRTDEGLVLAQTSLASEIMPTFTVVGDVLVIIQADSNVYVLKQSELIQVADSDLISESGISSEDLFAKLVRSSSFTLSAEAENPALIEHNLRDFIIDDAGSLQLYRDKQFKLIDDLSDLEGYKFGLSGTGLSYIISNFSTHQSLTTRFNPDVSDSSILIANANDIDFRIIGEDVFVNSINSEHYAGWRSTKIDNDNTEEFVDNAAFLFTYDIDEQKDKAYILYSDAPSAETLINPGVYVYDPDANNGLGFLREGEEASDDDEDSDEEAPSNDDDAVIDPLPENPEIKEKVEKRFGFLGADLVELPSSILGVNFEVNDKFAGFSVKTATDPSPITYFFEPDFVDIADDIKDPDKNNFVGSSYDSEIFKSPNPLGSAAQPSKAFQE
jgi:hypothetical protein